LAVGLHTHIGGGDDHWTYASRYTARVGFFLFIVTYSASSLARLFPNPTTKSLLRNRKYWGLAFATSHTIHLYAWYHVVTAPDAEVDWLYLSPAILAYIVLYAMALTSWNWAYRSLGKWWNRLHSFGIHYLWLIFAGAYALKAAFAPGQQLAGAILLLVALGALGLRIAARRQGKPKRA
ncbi:MAG TPA: hypothetical protein VLA37_06470, partial [Sphingomonadaceae bacterium]|nr:hypothetical protein [Sphingomonadaceae bacterium]